MLSQETSVWMLNQTDQLLAASNFTAFIILSALGIIILSTIRKLKLTGKTDLFWILLGVMLEAFGWSLHRLYYGVLNTYKLYEDMQAYNFIHDHRYISLIPMLLVYAGLILILSTVVSVATHSTSRIKNTMVAAAIVISLSWLSYWQLSSGYERKNQIRAEKIEQTTTQNGQIEKLLKSNAELMNRILDTEDKALEKLK